MFAVRPDIDYGAFIIGINLITFLYPVQYLINDECRLKQI
jgi:hypothetical protein